MHEPWSGVLRFPYPRRSPKPRTQGITVVIDHGLGLREAEDLAEVAAQHVDFVKLTSGTSAVTDDEVLRRKVGLLRAAGINVLAGGTFTEACVWQQAFPAFLERARAIGFNTVEVSDGTITLAAVRRTELIRQASDAGFIVLTEVGRKEWSAPVSRDEMCNQIRRDLAAGTFKVVIEAMDAGTGIGIFDDEGQPRPEEIDAILRAVDSADRLIWEAPLRHQQEYLVQQFGTDVNLGNVPPREALVLEALRRGLTGPTFRDAYMKGPLPS